MHAIETFMTVVASGIGKFVMTAIQAARTSCLGWDRAGVFGQAMARQQNKVVRVIVMT